MVPYCGRNNTRFSTRGLSSDTFVHCSTGFESGSLMAITQEWSQSKVSCWLSVFSNSWFLPLLPFLSSLILLFFCLPSYVPYKASKQIRQDIHEICLASSEEVASKFSPPTIGLPGIEVKSSYLEASVLTHLAIPPALGPAFRCPQ